MRPFYLRMKAFRGYDDQEIDFSGIISVLIAGPTGAGKSAIPGAILLALTGENGSADPAGHIKNGSDLCQVEFHFEHAGSVYRCLHTDSLKTARKKTDRQFAVRNGNGGWIPRGGKSLAETNAEILRVIGQSYNELTCGPFSLQDQSGRFLDPGEMRIDGKTYAGRSARLQVTIKMLGLSRYEGFRVTATAEARDLDGRAEVLEAQVAAADASLAGRPEAEAALGRSESACQAARRAAQQAQESIEALTGQLGALQAEIEAERRQAATLAADEKALADLGAAFQAKQATLDRYRGILAHRDEIETKAAESEDLGNQADALRGDLAGVAAEIRSLEGQKAPAAARVRASQNKLITLQAGLATIRRRLASREDEEAKVAALEHLRLDRDGAAESFRAMDEQIGQLRTRQQEIVQANSIAQEERGRILAEEKKIKAQADGLLPLIQGHEKRAAVMGQVPCLGVGDLQDRCPLLTDARESVRPLAELRGQHASLYAWQPPALPELLPTDELEATLRTLILKKAQHQGRLAALEQQIRTFPPAEAALAALAMLAEQVPGLLEEETRAQEEAFAATEELSGLELLAGTLAEKRRTIQATLSGIEASIDGLRRWVALVPELGLAERELPGLEADVGSLMEQLATLAARIAAASAAVQAVREKERTLAEATGELEAWRVALSRARADEQVAVDAVAHHRATLAGLEKLAREREAAAQEAMELRGRHSLLVALSEFYRQAPVMILENEAVPVLQEEANRFLARTTANRMNVRLETQREIKSRDALADGLEIYIRDWRGERCYDDYSGGQRFELALAFRVAWTKLQERRAGVGMDCLFVDEGFGSLSAGDLDAVMRALREIQTDFGFLAVISHVEAMRDLFPARIEVRGGGEDSRAELVRG